MSSGVEICSHFATMEVVRVAGFVAAVGAAGVAVADRADAWAAWKGYFERT